MSRSINVSKLKKSSVTTIVTLESSTAKLFEQQSFKKPELWETAQYIDLLGLPILPVAPQQDSHEYPLIRNGEVVKDKEGNPLPKFTGKNPSYLDERGKPHIIKHGNYQEKLPTDAELKEWFANPANGIGTLGGNNVVWLDFDIKNFNGDINSRFQSWLDAYPVMKDSWIERTHSGGYRVAVKCEKDFTNFSLDGVGGKHHGEALGDGRFTVLAPTVGVSGNRYECLNRAIPIEIESLESIGIFPVSVKNEKAKPTTKTAKPFTSGSLDISQEFQRLVDIKNFISGKALQILDGDFGKDRSASLNFLIKEVLGWKNRLAEVGLGILDDIGFLVGRTAALVGIDNERLNRIIHGISPSICRPSAERYDDLFFWQRLKKHYKSIFDEIAPQEIKDSLLKKVKDFYDFKVDSRVFQSQKALVFSELKNWVECKFTPNIVVDQQDFEYPTDCPTSGAIIAIKSPMGSAKTQSSLDRILAQYKIDNVGVFWISARNKLLFQVIGSADKKGLKIYHLNEDDSNDLLFDESISNALCTESLHKINSYFLGRDVYIDEILTVLEQITGGGTVSGSKQNHCLEVFKRMVQQARNVYLLDANLNDAICDLIAGFAPDKKLIKIENKRKPRQAKIQFLQTVEIVEETEEKIIRVKDKSPIIYKILDPYCVPWIVTDSRRLSENLEALLMKNGKWGVCINKFSTEESWSQLAAKHPNHPSFPADKRHSTEKWSDELLEDLNGFVERYKPEFFIGSPTIESGVSYTGTGHFTEKFSIFLGVLSSSGMMQMMFRNRDNTIPHSVLCPIKSLIPHKKNETTSTALMSQKVSEQIERLRMIHENRGKNYSELHQLAMERVNLDWVDFKFGLERIESFEKNNIRACLIDRLREAGHDVTIADELSVAEVKELEKLQAKELKEKEIIGIHEALPFESDDDMERVKKKLKTRETDYRIKKTMLLKNFPGVLETVLDPIEIISEYCLNDAKTKQRKNYYLLFNPEIESKINDAIDFNKLTAQHVGLNSLKDDRTDILHTMRELKLDEIIESSKSGLILHEESPEIAQRMEYCKKKKLNELFKVPAKTAKKSYNIKWLNGILEYVGIKLKAIEQKTINGVRKWFYGLVETPEEQKEKTILNECLKKHFDRLIVDLGTPKWENEKPLVFPQELREYELSQQDVKDTGVISVAKQLIDNVCNCTNEILLATATRLLAALESEAVRNYMQTIDYRLVEAHQGIEPF